jgi:HEAT repeat protein
MLHATSGILDLPTSDSLEILQQTNFGGESNQTQGPYMVLDSISEGLRSKTSATDILHISSLLDTAKTSDDFAKWMAVLETVAAQGNQDGFIQLLEELPSDSGNAHLSAKAELIGRVLGRIGSEKSVRAVLSSTNYLNDYQRAACEASVGYVQNISALKPIAEVIDGASDFTPQVALATRMLGQIPSEYSLQSLKNLAGDPNLDLSQIATQALQLLTQNNPGLNNNNQ